MSLNMTRMRARHDDFISLFFSLMTGQTFSVWKARKFEKLGMSTGNQLYLKSSDFLGSVEESLRNSVFEESVTCVYSADRMENEGNKG